MEALYHQTNKLVQEIQHLFQQLNNYVGDSSEIESGKLTFAFYSLTFF